MSSLENVEDHLARIFCENLEAEADWNADADELGMLAATFTDIATTERPAFVEQWVKVVEEALEGSAAEGRTEAAVRVVHELDAFGVLSVFADEDREEDGVPAEVTIGAACQALLEEDDEWHQAIVEDILEPGEDGYDQGDRPSGLEVEPEGALRYRVTFVEFGKPQVVPRSELILEAELAAAADSDDAGDGTCPMCERELPLTRHHLIPRQTHARYFKKGYTRELLNTCLDCCRPCHSAIHRIADNATLAREYNTLELIMAHPDIQRWVMYAAAQPVRLRR